MKTIKIIIGLLLGLVIIINANAQSKELAQKKMKALAPLVGNWSGVGWMMTPDRQRHEFTQKEWIEYALDGSVIQIKGQGRNAAGELVHNAMAIVSYDQGSDEYALQSYLENGGQTRAQIEIKEDGNIVWWFKTPENATIKYTIQINEDTWVENGKYSPDGEIWYPFIEFTLQKEG